MYGEKLGADAPVEPVRGTPDVGILACCTQTGEHVGLLAGGLRVAAPRFQFTPEHAPTDNDQIGEAGDAAPGVECVISVQPQMPA